MFLIVPVSCHCLPSNYEEKLPATLLVMLSFRDVKVFVRCKF